MLTDDILKLIGHTPLLKLDGTNIYAKLEYFNPLHSVKDRAALYMIEGAIGRGELAPGGTVVEATSGNTGIGLAAVAARKGLRLITVLPENMSEERKKLLRHLGAEVIETPADQGMAGSVRRANELAAELGAFVPDQFSNPDCITAHIETTAQEIVADLGDIVPDYLVLTFGSAGTLTGVSGSLKKVYPNIKCIAVEPKESPLLSEGIAGKHGIQGIGANASGQKFNRRSNDCGNRRSLCCGALCGKALCYFGGDILRRGFGGGKEGTGGKSRRQYNHAFPGYRRKVLVGMVRL